MSKEEWTFTEDQRDAVCNGELCPKCGITDSIKTISAVPDGVVLNASYRCSACREEWEGY